MSYLDTRDLYKRQCELQSELDDLAMELDDAEEAYTESKDNYLDLSLEEGATDPEAWLVMEHKYVEDAEAALKEWQDANQEELDELDTLETEVGSEWMHGETLIPEEDFEDYARDLATDTGAIDCNANWPLNHIDWEAAAADLRQDYSETDYQGTTYLFRAS